MSLAPASRLGPYEIRAPLGAGGTGEASWLPDSRRLLATYRNRLFILDSATGATRDLLPPGALPPHASLSQAITRDGRRVAFVERTVDGDIWAMTLP